MSCSLSKKELKAAFDFFDTNRNGTIELEELDSAMKSLGYRMTEEELRKMIAESDVNGDGEIDFQEFVEMMKKVNIQMEKREGTDLIEAFKYFDQDDSGYISRQNLSDVMKSLGEELSEQDLNEMMLIADINKDGVVDFDEFVLVIDRKGWGRKKDIIHERKQIIPL